MRNLQQQAQGAGAPAPERDRPRDIETRDRILDAAIACFTQYGNDKTTLNDVARVAGLSRQTIYRYFPDRAALLEEVDAHEARRLDEDVAKMARDSPPLEVFLARLVTNRMTVHSRYRVREHLLDRDLGLVNSMLLSRERQLSRIRELVIPQLEAARSRGELRPGADVVGAAEWIAINVATLPTLVSASSFDLDNPDSVAAFFATHLCRGLVAAR